MKFLRSMLGWILIGLGAIAIGLWASASLITHKVDSGSIASPFMSTVLHQDDIQNSITQQVQVLMSGELAQNGVVIAGTPEEATLNAAIASVVASDAFIDDLVDVLEGVEASIIAQMTDDTLPIAPLTISINISEPLQTSLADHPEVAGYVPNTTLDPVTFEPLSADEVVSVRDRYDLVQTAATWGIWVGLLLIALGIVVLPRKRWIIPKLLLGVGLTALLGWFLASKTDIESLLNRLPEDSGGGFKSMMTDLLPQSRVDRLQSALLVIAIILLSLAALAYWLVWFLSRRKRSRAEAASPVPPAVETAPPIPLAGEIATPISPVVETAPPVMEEVSPSPEVPDTPTAGDVGHPPLDPDEDQMSK